MRYLKEVKVSKLTSFEKDVRILFFTQFYTIITLMAKKAFSSSKKKSVERSFISRIFSLKGLIIIGAIWGIVLYSSSNPQSTLFFQNWISSLFHQVVPHESEIMTFEMRYDEEAITQLVMKKLPSNKYNIKNENHLLYTPYLIVDVKHLDKKRQSTEESTMIWDLLEGEMVVSFDSFQVTSGFRDCMTSQASLDDFRFLHLLNEQSGSMTKENLIALSGFDDETASSIIDSLKKRHLITIQNNIVRLHVKNPLFGLPPKTEIKEPFVYRKISTKEMIPEIYSKKTVENMIRSAYGKDIAILDTAYLWIPVWEVDIENPDGSIRKTFWNALTGQSFQGKFIKK